MSTGRGDVVAITLLALLVWSPFTRELVTPEVLEQQGVTEYGVTGWALVRAVVTGESSAMPSAPTALTLT